MTRLLDPLRDLRAALRLLKTRPGWTLAAVLCLAIATGANTAAFTIVNGLLLRPLPFDDPTRLVMVALQEPTQPTPRPFGLREYRELAEHSGATATLLARTFLPLSVAAGDGARMAQAELVSGNYFGALRVAPFLGSFFGEESDRERGEPLAVLSHRMWRLRFGADPAVVGQAIRVNGRPVPVAGVAPPAFTGAMQLIAADLWLPATMYPELAGAGQAATLPVFGVMGRLADRVAVEQASARLTSLNATLAGGVEGGRAPRVRVTAAAGFGVPIAVAGSVLTASKLIYAMMALLMAVACANVAALVLARGAGRGREIALRLSLGASRMQIARQLLSESVLLAVAGCALGTVVALWLTQALVASLTTPFQYVTYAIDVRPDALVLAYSALATALAAVLCGIVPMRVARRTDPLEVLKQSSTRAGAPAYRRTLDALVVGQFAVSATLLLAAGMLVRAYVEARAPRPGFDAARLLAATMDVGQARLDEPGGIRLYQALRDRLGALPGVAAVALASEVPLTTAGTVMVSALDSARGSVRRGERLPATGLVVSGHYFETLGTNLRQGRSFEEVEPADPAVALIDQEMADRLWPGTSAVGQSFLLEPSGSPAIQVIGVVSSGRDGGTDSRPVPTFYRPFAQAYAARMTVLMRVRGEAETYLGEVRRTVRELNPDLAIVDLRTVEELMRDRAQQWRMPATVLALVGLLGLLLSAVGLYGVVAYGVRERTRELGIRLALGARPLDLRRLVLRQGFATVFTGLAFGAAGTVALMGVARSIWFGVGPPHPATVLGVLAVLLSVASVALYLPARWASRVEPAETLRRE